MTAVKKFFGSAALARLGLRTRVYLLLGGLLCVNMAGPVIMVWYAAMARDLYTATADKDLAALTAAHELENALLNQKGYATYYYLSQDPTWLVKLDESRRAFALWLERMRQQVDAPEAVTLLDGIDAAYKEYTAAKDNVVSLYQQGRVAAAEGQHWAVREDFDGVRELCDRFKEFFRARMRETGEVYIERTNMVMAVAVVGVLINATLGFFLAYVLVGQILDPIRRLARGERGKEPLAGFSDEVKAIGQKFRDLEKDVDKAQMDLEQSRGHLMQSEKLAMAGRLAAGVAHTIRNPLTSVKMRLFSLERGLKLDPSQKEDFEVIAEEIGHIDTIVRNFLEFARPPKLTAQPVSLSAVVDTTLNLLKHRLESYNVAVTVERARALPEISADPDQLKEALVNLVLNACEAMVEGGRLRIREETGVLEPHGRIVALRVSDSGPGVDPALFESVFQPFFTTKGEGSGLGLPIVKRIVEEHGGWITIQSPPGDGTTFTMVFPCEGERGWHRS
ncbi:sensor histidine kinase [Solidesulfovibrio sp.]|uniref:sensor histidine kinase n=1 Tax=Solidesulfovibrio sp. TaxID=2910990 RepID=UPI000EB997A5|nr:ATP-binding protein [Solidesulfovibrio sp.]MEA5087353.1 ATP-binding protein [Solidesulfovibrio sp.]HCR13358.1 histidine kinase [Desulfovibrio sp.]HML62000.1 ATP-binding protein [Solidesulfovibrio sp.]